MTLQLMMMHHNIKFGNKTFRSLKDLIWTNVNILTLHCDLDLECSHPFFSRVLLFFVVCVQGMDRPGVRQVPEGSGEQGKMEKTGCKIICGAPTTLAVKALMMMMKALGWWAEGPRFDKLRLSVLFKNCGLWTLSCDFSLAHTVNETLNWLTQLPTLMQNHSDGDRC